MSTAPASPKSPLRVLALSTTAFTLLFAVWLMFGVLGVPIKKELHLDTVQFAWLGAIAVLSGSIWRLPLGILADRVGGRSLFVALLLVSAIPTYLVSHATTFKELLACAFFFGLGGNAFSIGIAWNAAWADKQRQGFALGVFGAGNVGASITKLAAPGLIALLGSWRVVPQIYAALLVVMALVLWGIAPSPDRRPGSGRPLRAMLAPLRDLRTWRFGLSLLRPVGGWLSDKFGPRPVTYAVFVAMLLACVPLALPRGAFGVHVGPVAFFWLVEVLGIGMGLGKASVYKYIPDYFPADVGATGGLVGTLGALGGFVLPLAFGYLETSTGRPESCFQVMLCLVLACLVWLHAVVSGLRRGKRLRFRSIELEVGNDRAGAGA